ncbi:TIGR02300 family protein [Corallococcus sp. AB011P]|uniref:FYDLN acid domain-containing protein n=1 Tax=unclassified Corallococcus TaxID=2685029 RepID=UPI000EA356C0|nr:MULTISPECIES: FYDLN acid domain-containing protein [unclassified Corallococcus]RKG53065.1 TIGR02300 family protein [Corallococcus sp. AB011P]RKH81916.1 TIGR02300 family protein [Corallococcus sp. AB045]
MPAKDLGTKHSCFKCGTKFYDMKKPDPICPKCGADQRENVVAKPTEGRRGRLAAAPKVIEPEPEETPAAEEDEENLDSFSDDEDAEATTETSEEDDL